MSMQCCANICDLAITAFEVSMGGTPCLQAGAHASEPRHNAVHLISSGSTGTARFAILYYAVIMLNFADVEHPSASWRTALFSVSCRLSKASLNNTVEGSCCTSAGYLSAVCHDLDHKGLNNDFLVKSSDALAIEYNDLSPLENHHLAQSFRLLTRPDCNVLSHLSKEKQVVASPCRS